MPKATPSRRVIAGVAQQLKAERIRQQLSMTHVADKSGLSQQMVSYVERGMLSPTLDTLLRISAVLDVDLWKVIKAASEQAKKR